jgi:hypothetical protein
MNPSPSSSNEPSLQLPRRAVPAEVPAELSAESRWQLEIDLAGLRERETNLREYEARLRAWQEQLDAAGRSPAIPGRSAPPLGVSSSPFALPNDFELRGAWEKLHRARALLEAEQKQLRDDRIVMRDTVGQLDRREAELTAREAAVTQREQQVAAAEAAIAAVTVEEKPASAVRRLAQAPLQAARAVFKPGH